MRKVLLRATQDIHSDTLGLIVDGMSWFDMDQPYVGIEGMTVAHDLIEHQNGVEKIGGVADELEAIGAGWWIRGQFGCYFKNGDLNPSDTILAREVSAMMEQVIQQSDDLGSKVPRTNRHMFDEVFQFAIEEAQSINRTQDDHFARQALAYMRTGVRKAERRFNSLPLVANNLFWHIADAVDAAIDSVELYEGLEFDLVYGDGHAVCKPILEEW